jgi:hypothetical protein
MTIARSTDCPGTARVSATSSGAIALARGEGSSARRRRSEQQGKPKEPGGHERLLQSAGSLVEVGPEPAGRGFEIDAAPLCIVGELIRPDARTPK